MYDLKPNNGEYGATGYPMLITILAGMELIGALTYNSSGVFDPHKGHDHFSNFWNVYFVTMFPEYKGLDSLFRQLVRNGISHIFLAKKGVMVTKGSGKRPIVDKSQRLILIDANKLFDDFEKVINKKILPLLTVKSGEPSKASMQTMLKKIEQEYDNSELEKLYKSLSISSAVINGPMVSGASLSTVSLTGNFATVSPSLQAIFDKHNNN